MTIALFLGAPAGASAADPVVAGAGDAVCKGPATLTGSRCHYGAVSDLVVNDPTITDVLGLGDMQYECGDYPFFQQYYDPTWGRFKAKTHPIPGNHEYWAYGVSGQTGCDPGTTTPAKGYFDYFNGLGAQTGPAGDRSQGYYSFDVGPWHLIALNSNCTKVSCSSTSAQRTWLKNDLAAHPTSCTLAYIHAPRFSSGSASSSSLQTFWQDLYDAGADVVVAAHEHFYERFARLGRVPSSSDKYQPQLDPNGMREFVVGTGGKSHTAFATIRTGSEARNSTTYGILKLGLHAGGYDWSFVPEPGGTFTDSGSDTCVGQRTADTQAPTAPSNLKASASSAHQVDLSWTASSDNVGVTKYEIQRRPVGGTFAKIATTSPTTSYSDTTVAPDTTYDYRVRALDGAGNASPYSNIASATTSSGSQLIFSPEADAMVKEVAKTTNYGADVDLRSDGGSDPDVQSYLRFTVSGVSGTVQSARLRLYASSSTADGPGLYTVSDNTWPESGITWTNKPLLGNLIEDKAGIPSGVYTEWDVTSVVAGNGTYSFGIGSTPTTDGVDWHSKEDATKRPEFVVTFGT